MRWTDEGIVLSVRKHGETSAVARVFACTHGVAGGIIKGALSKSNRGIAQSGNIVNVTWNARLAEHLGMFRMELLEPVAVHLMHDAGKLAALSSACALIESALPEHHPYGRLYGEFREFLRHLVEEEYWLQSYIRLELSILAESGFGLDLSQCAATGTTEGLCYVSPKSGRAVSRAAGEPYRERLLELPGFLLTSPERGEVGSQREPGGGMEETLAGLRLSGYFLDRRLLGPHGKKLPAARGRLVEMMKEHGKETAGC